ncbi:hypothetical protein H0A65_00380 [Alcaligenaceae bacterium]|nr:hypothetical protein [Alcaligenaceae bacterium]
MLRNLLFGESASTKIAAIFDTESAAATAAAALHAETGIQAGQLRLIKPHDQGYAKKLEPEITGIARTALRAHSSLGLAGAVIGLVAWGLAYVSGLPTITSSPVASAIAFIFLAAIAGMLLGGLITARPDHQIVIQRVHDANKAGQWSLLVHPRSSKQCDAAMDVLTRLGPEIVRSL